MTRQYKIIREENKLELGFGVEVMKMKKVCTICGTVADSSQGFCRECGEALPEETMYEAYAKRHRRCRCGVVVSEVMKFCPVCGKLLPPNKVLVTTNAAI